MDFAELMRDGIEELANSECYRSEVGQDWNPFDEAIVQVGAPSGKAERIGELESLDLTLRRVKALQLWCVRMKRDICNQVLALAEGFELEYDEEKLLRAAAWLWNRRGIKKLEAEPAEDGLAYIGECLRKIGIREFDIVQALRPHGMAGEGLSVQFTIPDVLGMFEVRFPFRHWDLSRDNPLYGGDIVPGKYKENSPFPMQMQVCYTSPINDGVINGLFCGWYFAELKRNWEALDFDEVRKFYAPQKVVDGVVWEKKKEHGVECEYRTGVSEVQYYALVKEAHDRMLRRIR